MRRISRHASIIGYFLALAVLAADALLVASSLSTIDRGNAQVDHGRKVVFELDRVLSSLKDAETGQRGYLLLGREDYLAPYRSAEAEIAPALGELRTLGARDGLGGRFDALAGVAAEKMAELSRTVRLREQGRDAEALAIVRTDRGKDLMDRARSLAAGIRAEEGAILDARQSASRTALRRTVATFALTTGLALVLLAGAATLQRREAAGFERAAEAVRSSEAWLSTTLSSLGDAVIATDEHGRVKFLNPVAQGLTGWPQAEARGRPMAEVFPIINEHTREPAEDPVEKVIREGTIVGLANHTLLVRRDGHETPIDDSAAPIEDERGAVAGVVLVFRDITGRRRQDALIDEQRRLAEFGRDVGLVLTESPDLATMARRCSEEAVRHLDGAFARIWAVDEPGEVLELLASAGLYTHVDGPHARVPVGQFKIGAIARDRRPHLTNSVVGDPRVPAQDWAREQGMVAFAGYPLVVDDRMVGVWAMFARHELSEATLRAMESVARGIAVGIERHQAEAKLRREREWLQVTLASIGDAVIATDGEGRVRFLNAVASGLTGWSPEEAAGRPIGRVFHIVNEQTREPAEDPVERVIREGGVVGLANHTVVIARDGTETPIEDSAAPIKDGQGEVIGVVMVFQDATARRRHESALGESERRFRTLAESIPQLAWMARPDGHIDWYNRRWYEYTGTTPEEMEGWGWRKVHDPEALPAVLERWQGSIATGEPFDMVFPLRGADGQFRPFLTRVMPVRDEEGRVAQWFGTNTDIADRQKIEDELKAARDEAEHANAAKTQFLAVLSHELRTPLNPILLAVSSMLERPPGPDDVRSNLEMIRQNVNLQSRLIDDLLDVMRIVRGKMPLHWEVVDVHSLIDHSVGICRSEVFGKGLKLTIELGASCHHLNADPVRLQQVFWNLIKNAVKFTPDGGSIAIRTRNEPEDEALEERLVIEVADTGIGLEPQFVERIFDPFQQGETSITRRFGGLGLGLAISKGIVEGHGGVLKAESPGKDRGTTFRLELRAMPDPLREEAGRPDPRATSADPSSPTSPLKILLVEDEQATRRLMARLLKGLGHDVATAGTILEALEKEKAGEFGLIVSDIGLPDGSGLELMKQVVARRGQVPAIALTGYGMEEDIQRSREAGFTAHMTKPIDFTKLEAMIRQVAS